MQRFDGVVREGQDVLYNNKVLVRNVTLKETKSGKEVVAENKNFNYNASHCTPVYIDECQGKPLLSEALVSEWIYEAPMLMQHTPHYAVGMRF